MHRSLLLGPTVAAVLLVTGIPASACDFEPPPPPAEAADDADAVFAGSVIDVEDQGDLRIVATLQVEAVWSGSITERTAVVTGSDTAMCGYPFERGSAYLVYANEVDGELRTSIATRTAPIDGAEEDLAALGEPASPEADPSVVARAPWWAVAGVLAVVAALAVAGPLWRRRASDRSAGR